MNGTARRGLAIFAALAMTLTALAGCAGKVMAPRIPAMKQGSPAPFGPEPVLPETGISLKEAPEGIRPAAEIK